jgi:hypothetical protein
MNKRQAIRPDSAVTLSLKKQQAEKDIQEVSARLQNSRLQTCKRSVLMGKLAESYKIIGDTDMMCTTCREIIDMIKHAPRGEIEKFDPKRQSAINYHFHKAHVMLAPYSFHHFLLCLEWNEGVSIGEDGRQTVNLEEKFYTPRISVLGPIAEKLQWFSHQKRHILTLSMPQGMGKTECGKRYMAWQIGRNPNLPNMMLSYAASIAKDKFFTGVDTIIQSPEYQEIFPAIQKIYSNADTLTLDYRDDGKKALHSESTLYCVGFDSSITGRTRARGTLYIDDVVKDTAESSNPDLMEKKTNRLKSDVLKRMQGGCNLLFIGTIFASDDPMSQIIEFFKEHYPDRLTEIRIPGGNEETGKSNFSGYYGKLAYTDEMFQQDKALMDPYDFQALIQQNGLERQGLVFEESALKFDADHLPAGEPDLVCFAADIAWGGGDYFSMPIAKQYGMDAYIVDVVHLNAPKETTQPIVEEKIISYGCTRGFMEANNGGDEYCAQVDKDLRKHGIRCNIICKKAPNTKSKLDRILACQSEIKGIIPDNEEKNGVRLHFLSRKGRSKLPDGGKMYNKYIEHLTSFNQSARYQGKQKDDAADATASIVTNVLEAGQGPSLRTLPRSALF